MSADTADIRITGEQDTIAVRVGQTVGLKQDRDVRWQVTFSNAALQLLTPIEKLPSPGDEGWVWRALTPGVTVIMLTSTTPCATPPCSPNVQRFTYTLNVTN